MKKVLCAMTLSFVVTTAFSQLSFGVKVGGQCNLRTFKQEIGDEWNRTHYSAFGFHAGAIMDYRVSTNFSIQPNLLFSMKSVRPSSTGELTLYTIDLPVNLLYRSNGFFAGVGPNFSYGLSAKREIDGTPDVDYYEGSPAEYNRFEVGVNAVLGYQFSSGFAINAFYTPGLSNLNNDTDADEQKISTRVSGLSLSYMFNGNKAKK